MISPVEVPKGVRPNLIAERTKRRLPVTTAAKLIGVHPNAWSRWESGKTTPDSENLLKICALFDADPAYILEKA